MDLVNLNLLTINVKSKKYLAYIFSTYFHHEFMSDLIYDLIAKNINKI